MSPRWEWGSKRGYLHRVPTIRRRDGAFSSSVGGEPSIDSCMNGVSQFCWRRVKGVTSRDVSGHQRERLEPKHEVISQSDRHRLYSYVADGIICFVVTNQYTSSSNSLVSYLVDLQYVHRMIHTNIVFSGPLLDAACFCFFSSVHPKLKPTNGAVSFSHFFFPHFSQFLVPCPLMYPISPFFHVPCPLMYVPFFRAPCLLMFVPFSVSPVSYCLSPFPCPHAL